MWSHELKLFQLVATCVKKCLCEFFHQKRFVSLFLHFLSDFIENAPLGFGTQFAFHSRAGLIAQGNGSDKSAGGGPKHLSFINNPSFQVPIGEATKIEIYLRQKIATQSCFRLTA